DTPFEEIFSFSSITELSFEAPAAPTPLEAKYSFASARGKSGGAHGSGALRGSWPHTRSLERKSSARLSMPRRRSTSTAARGAMGARRHATTRSASRQSKSTWERNSKSSSEERGGWRSAFHGSAAVISASIAPRR